MPEGKTVSAIYVAATYVVRTTTVKGTPAAIRAGYARSLVLCRDTQLIK